MLSKRGYDLLLSPAVYFSCMKGFSFPIPFRVREQEGNVTLWNEILRLFSHQLQIKNTIVNRTQWDENAFTSVNGMEVEQFLKIDYMVDYLGSTFRDSDLIALELYPKPKSRLFFVFSFPNLLWWFLSSSKGLELLEWRTGGVPLLCHYNSVFFSFIIASSPYNKAVAKTYSKPMSK